MRTILFPLFLLAQAYALTPAESLQRILEGNRRYIKDQLEHPNHSSDRREAIAKGQMPFCIIVGCSDSRVAPEIIFDQGLGDLFIVRVARNVVGPVELDSIEYSAEVLGSSLILVLGHEACGAVTAVMKGQTQDIEDIAQLIKPAIRGAKTLEAAIKANVKWVVSALKQNTVLGPLIASKKLDCIGAYYHLGTGQVEILK